MRNGLEIPIESQIKAITQVFFTHKGKIEKQSTQEDRDAVRQSLGDNVEPLDQKEEDELLDAYK